MTSEHPSLYVGRPNIGDRAALLARINGMLDRRWLSNDGPLVSEFEQRICELLGVKHALALCNATIGLEIASKALGLVGEVIVPSYTFVATAHALQWQGIKPVFCDIDPATHNLDPACIEKLITPRTTGIVGVHVWGRPCDTEGIESVAHDHGLKVMYDAAHAFGCSSGGKMIGGFGECEVFSFHATKFINCFEGGAVTTNNDELAEQMRLMRNFGFAGFDNVIYPGVNGKMSEVCAAMGLTSLEAMDAIVEVNKRNYLAYREGLQSVPGVSVIRYDEAERNNTKREKVIDGRKSQGARASRPSSFDITGGIPVPPAQVSSLQHSCDWHNYQYVVIEVDQDICPCNRDEIVAALHAENIIARKYFWPGCHRMEPYRTTQPDAWKHLPETERVAARVIVLPTGQTVDEEAVRRVCGIIARCATMMDGG